MPSQPVMQKSFNSGEWAPQLNARVDIEKYHSGAALMLNFFVDYRGGASTRAGTQYILQAFKSGSPVRLIPFQASLTVSYILEFGDQYIRFYNNKAPVLEAALNITGATQANPCVVTVANTWAIGDWVFIASVGGMTQLNGNYYRINARSAGTITLGDLNGNPINSTAYNAYTAGGTTSRVYTIASPYAAADLALVKFAQNINSMILCHPSYSAQQLTLISANNWVITSIPFGTEASAPTIFASASTLGAGTVNYSYIVTSVNSIGDESIASVPVSLTDLLDLRTTQGSNTIAWNPVAGAVSYNVYKSDVSYFGVVPSGVPYGYIGNVSGNSIIDSNITPDFSITPPIGQNPFQGSAVATITQTNTGSYTNVPSVIFSGGSPNAVAVANAILQVQGTPTVGVGGAGTNYVPGDHITLSNGVVVRVSTVTGSAISSFDPITGPGCNPGQVITGHIPTNPVAQVTTTGIGTGATVHLDWGVGQTQLINGGSGYLSTPTITYQPGSGGATATAALAAASNANPSVPGFFQQRLTLGAAVGGPQTLNFSQPGSYYNYNTNNPTQPDDAISVSLASGQLQTIKSILPIAPGLIVYTDKASWLINGGSLGSAISPSSIVANLQSNNGSNDMPPILNNYDILTVSAKGSSVRDATYNYYAQVFTGTDISIISSHLFYGYQLLEWAWAQEPFKLVWAVRNDGQCLSLTFAKEEEFIAWTHHNTTNGLFKSVATVVETTSYGNLDAVYFVIERIINGNTVKYIERLAERIFPNGVRDAWTVDAAIQYNGAPTTNFKGAPHLAGEIVTGLADGVPIVGFVMPVNGEFTLPNPASKVTVGLRFNALLQTLAIDTGEPTIQGKQKKISGVTVRVEQTLGLQIGSTFSNLVYMQDLQVGSVGSMTNQIVTDLVTGDAQTIIDPKWAAQGQFCLQQALPYPATITGVIPRLAVGDTR